MVERLNDCAQAISDIRETSMMHGHRTSRDSVGHVLGWLDAAETFILPNSGELLDGKNVQQTRLDLMHLPCPVIAAESPCLLGSLHAPYQPYLSLPPC